MIRKYQTSDLEAVVAIWFNASFLAHPFLSQAFLEAEERNIRDVYLPATQTWVYLKHKNVVGFISMLQNEIGGLFIDPVFQGMGIGTALINHVTQQHQKLEVAVFEKNTVGRLFYNKFGFSVTGKQAHPETDNTLLRLTYERF